MMSYFKKKTIAALFAVGAAIMGPGAADAGTLQVNHTIYAVEAVCPNTQIPLGDIIYTMGITRLPDQAFEIRYELPEGVVFNNGFNLMANFPAAFVNLRSGGAGYNFVEYDISPNFGNIPAGTTITLAGATVTNVSFPSAGSMMIIKVELRDKISYPNPIDNTPVTGIIATGAYAADFWNSSGGMVGVKTDTDTSIDGGYSPPLAGFVVQGDDKALAAAATVQIRNTTPGVRDPRNPNADYVLQAADKVVITVDDPTGFLGLKDKGLWWDLNSNGKADSGEIFTVRSGKATLTLNGNNPGFGSDHKLYYEVDGETMLTERTLSISGNVNASCGTDHDISGNDEWWIWNCPMGIVLQAPFFQVPPGWHSRFVLTNDCPSDAPYEVRYLSERQDENGNPVSVTVTPNAGQNSGTVLGRSTLVLDAQRILSLSGTDAGTRPRGTAIFTLDAPSACIQGLYQVVNAAGSAVSNHVMVRPGTN